MSRLTPMLVVLLCLSFMTVAPPALAQDASPAASPASTTASLDLAAMVLRPDELPAGFTLGDGSTYTPGNLYGIAFAPHVSNEKLVAAGYLRNYEAYYDSLDGSEYITVSIDEYATPDGAKAGFSAFTEDTRPSPNFTVLSTTELPVPAVGEDPRVFSLTTYQYRDDSISDYVDATFRIDNFIARITYERFVGQATEGTPAASAATPVTLNPSQTEQVEQVEAMAAILVGRIEAVRDGESPPGVDLASAERVLPLAQLPNVWNGESWEGHQDAASVLGAEGPLFDTFASDFRNGYGRTVSISDRGSPRPPYLSIAVSEWASTDAAMALLEAVGDAPADLPTPGPYPVGALHSPVADFSLPEAGAALAFTAVLDDEDPAALSDSGRIVFVTGPYLVSVDVQGMESSDAAMSVATDLASQQVACLLSGDPCSSATMPAP